MPADPPATAFPDDYRRDWDYGPVEGYSPADPYDLPADYGVAGAYDPGDQYAYDDRYEPDDRYEAGPWYQPDYAQAPAEPAAGYAQAPAEPAAGPAAPPEQMFWPDQSQPPSPDSMYSRAPVATEGGEPTAEPAEPDWDEPSWPAEPPPAGATPAEPPLTAPGAADPVYAGQAYPYPAPHAPAPTLPAPTATIPPPTQPPTAPSPAGPAATDGRLSPEYLLPTRRRAPAPGWRRIVYQASGGLLRVPVSAAELRRRDMISRVRTPVVGGHHRVAILSLKGGVGKTTTTFGLGATLASLRGDRVIAVDANPDRGTLSDKVDLETAATVRDLLNERDRVRRYADVRAFTSQAPSRLEVLASDRDPTVSVAFSGDDYAAVCGVLEHYYSICLTDCGTGLMHSAMAGVLRLADQIILVSSPSVDGARSASATLDWLAAHSYGHLVRDAVVVLSVVRPRSRSTVDLNRMAEHFAARCRAVTRIPWDAHLEEGAEVELDQLTRPTADAYLALAALIGDGFAGPPAGAASGAEAAGLLGDSVR